MMTENEYRQALKELNKTKSFITADEDFNAKLDTLADNLKAMITDNTEDLICTDSTTYYVSAEGDDSADGKSPDTAWRTIERLNTGNFSKGDLVVFRRGDLFRGEVLAHSGVNYSAYGKGPKPKIYMAWDGKTKGNWVKTDIPNVWVLDAVLDDADIGLLVFNDGENYAEKRSSLGDIKNDLDFVYNCKYINEDSFDNRVYLRCDKGNPADVFDSIDISRKGSVIKMPIRTHDVWIKNLELNYAQDIFFVTRGRNIRMSYCVCGWTGGTYYNKQFLRYGGGAGGWHSCNGFYFDHCYIYQQLDSGVTPQYVWKDDDAGVFKDFSTTDCLFEACEWTFEYYHTQKNVIGNRFENMYFGYNICRKGGRGFGAQGLESRVAESAYVKSWGHENACFNSRIEYNVFDRAAALSLEIIGHELNASGKFDISYDRIPKLNNNIYIEPKDKKFANINNIFYRFNEASKITLERLGADTDSVYIFSE